MRIRTEVNIKKGSAKLVVESNGTPDIWCDALSKAIDLCGTMASTFDYCARRCDPHDRSYILSIVFSSHYCQRKALAAAIISARRIVRMAQLNRGSANATYRPIIDG